MIEITKKVIFQDSHFSLLDIRKRRKRSRGIRKNVNLKRQNRHVLSPSDLRSLPTPITYWTYCG